MSMTDSPLAVLNHYTNLMAGVIIVIDAVPSFIICIHHLFVYDVYEVIIHGR
ncbi:hypothetical protein J2Z83_003904 [Virgibacillus natechei]|uniref:Uncharacterized protein n=1 Tax=Virgibacillus natechei TaxID=1216297 RepID=A0ABS4ILB0_9BACI|nr:hypothetical protein [Virgibacillus natechei]